MLGSTVKIVIPVSYLQQNQTPHSELKKIRKSTHQVISGLRRLETTIYGLTTEVSNTRPWAACGPWPTKPFCAAHDAFW